MLELNEREKLERERDTRREREKKKEGGREGGEAGVRREGKARQGKDFLGEKSSLWQKDLKKVNYHPSRPIQFHAPFRKHLFLEGHSFRFVTICPS